MNRHQRKIRNKIIAGVAIAYLLAMGALALTGIMP